MCQSLEKLKLNNKSHASIHLTWGTERFWIDTTFFLEVGGVRLWFDKNRETFKSKY